MLLSWCVDSSLPVYAAAQRHLPAGLAEANAQGEAMRAEVKAHSKGHWARDLQNAGAAASASAATLTEPPRRRAFEPSEAGEAAWCTEMGNLSGTAFTEFRSPRTSYEYDVYTWTWTWACLLYTSDAADE